MHTYIYTCLYVCIYIRTGTYMFNYMDLILMIVAYLGFGVPGYGWSG